eukprot:15913-Heterococcus_DN1.PRE.3
MPKGTVCCTRMLSTSKLIQHASDYYTHFVHVNTYTTATDAYHTRTRVTQKGLEEQLLGRVIGKEQQALEEQLSEVLEEVNSNTKALLALTDCSTTQQHPLTHINLFNHCCALANAIANAQDASLLERLTSNSGNLLEDEELIGVLANTKAKAAEVNQKLIAADETRKNINEKREQFRPVATRGSVLYFAIVEMSLVNVMYQTSLDQFLALFMGRSVTVTITVSETVVYRCAYC